MGNKMDCVLRTFVILAITETVNGLQECKYYLSSSNYYGYADCDNGCCVTGDRNPCCEYNPHGKSSSEDSSATAIFSVVISCVIAFVGCFGICKCACNSCKEARLTTQANSDQNTRQSEISHISTTSTQNVHLAIMQSGNEYINDSFINDQSAPPYNDITFAPPPSYEAVINDPKYVAGHMFDSPTAVLNSETYDNQQNVSEYYSIPVTDSETASHLSTQLSSRPTTENTVADSQTFSNSNESNAP